MIEERRKQEKGKRREEKEKRERGEGLPMCWCSKNSSKLNQLS